jgi:hypothetical protein
MVANTVAKAAKISNEHTHVHKHNSITHPKPTLHSLRKIHHERGTGDTVWADIVKKVSGEMLL